MDSTDRSTPDPAEGPAFELWRGATLLLVVGFGTLCVLRPAGWQLGEAWIFSDAAAYHIPKYDYAASRIARGDFPLWNPHEYGGIPFLATLQTGVVYPPVRLIYSVWQGETAYALLFYLHLMLGAGFTLALFRELRCSLWPSVLTSTWIIMPVWMIGGFEHSSLVGTAIWVPLLLLLLQQLWRAPSLRSSGWFALAAASMFAAGYPPVGLPALLALVLWLAAASLQRARGPLRTVFMALSSAGLLTLLLASIQLLPASELMLDTERATGVEDHFFQKRAGASAAEARMLGLPPVNLADGLQRTWSTHGPLLLLLCAGALWMRRRSPFTWAAAVAAIVSSLVPGWVFFKTPPYQVIRFGVEWGFMAPFFLYLLAGLGMDAVVRRWRVRSGVAAALALLVLAFTTAWSWREAERRFPQIRETRWAELDARVADACQVGVVGSRLHWPAGQATGLALRDGLYAWAGYEPLLPARTAELYRALGVSYGYERLDGARFPGALSRMSLRCIVSALGRPDLVKAGFVRVRGSKPPQLAFRLDGLDRVRMAFEHRGVGSGAEARELLLAETLPAEVVILEGVESELTHKCVNPDGARVQIRTDTPEELEIDVSTPCAGHLVVSDAYATGWAVEVGGVPSRLLRADYLFRAVALGPGEHRVIFRYRPSSFVWGAALSVCGLFALGALLAWPGARDPLRRRSG